MHKQKVNDLYSLPHIIREIKLRRIRLDGPVANMVKNRIVVHKPEAWRLLG